MPEPSHGAVPNCCYTSIYADMVREFAHAAGLQQLGDAYGF